MQLLVLFIFLFQSIVTNPTGGTIEITVSNIKSEKGGHLSAAIFTKEYFLDNDQAILQKAIKVNASTMKMTFANVPPGEYAMAFFQDIDEDEKLSTNLIGFPKEPFGFSNNAKLRFGPPSFKDAAIRVEAGKMLKLSVKLR